MAIAFVILVESVVLVSVVLVVECIFEINVNFESIFENFVISKKVNGS